jgi:hypothetical protein
MSTDLKAIPTEYNGIRFRSKSEAIFARCLDLVGFYWEYEPEVQPEKRYATDIRSWDFLIAGNGIGPNLIRHNEIMLVEYKPSQPTETYVENLKKMVSEWAGDLLEAYLPCYVTGDATCGYTHTGEPSVIFRQKVHPYSSCFNFSEMIPRREEELLEKVDQTSCGNFGFFSFSIVYGNMYSANSLTHIQLCDWCYGKRPLWRDPLGITKEILQESRSYRFDLKH